MRTWTAAWWIVLAAAAIGWPGAPSALADPIKISYEGDDFPEDVGWTRQLNGGQPGRRSLADGIFTLDTLADGAITDWYEVRRPGEMTLNPGEMLALEWRMRFVKGTPPGLSTEPSVGVFLDNRRGFGFSMGEDRLWGAFDFIQVAYEPGVFHEFRAMAFDTTTYALFMDGEHVADGRFFQALTLESFVSFGATLGLDASIAEWDYVRMRIIPEPASWTMVLASLMVFCMRRELRREMVKRCNRRH